MTNIRIQDVRSRDSLRHDSDIWALTESSLMEHILALMSEKASPSRDVYIW
jgi:hypothetical protein